MKKKIKHTKPKGLTDKQLIEKYGTGGGVNFDKSVKMMCITPSASSLSKFKP